MQRAGRRGAHGVADAGTDAMGGPVDAGLRDATLQADATPAAASTMVATEAGTVLPASAPVRHSSITFQSLFDGNEDEANAAQRLTTATFRSTSPIPATRAPGGSDRRRPVEGS